MTEAFLKIVNMSISAGWLVLAVLVLRLVLKKAPRWIYVLLWGIVAVRLICPFSIESALSLIPSAETISPEIMMDPTPAVTTGIPALNSALNPVISDSFAPNPGNSANPLQIWIPIASAVWAIGAAGMLAYALISYLRLKKRVSTAFPIGKNIRQSEYIDSPFVLGLFRPVIYLPFRLDSADMEPVIAHELTHIRRKDHWWKPLGYTLLAVHWFNPLMWVAYILLCRDIELACDEQVIAGLDSESRADYTQALVACAVNRRTIAACPLAFGEVGVKERVKSVMNYRKPGFWIVVIAVIICSVVAVCFLTNPVTTIRNPAVQEYVPGAEGIRGSVDTGKYTAISEDFAIGADRYGRAVFKDPHKAFDTLLVLYSDGIDLIRSEHHLPPLGQATIGLYKTYGWQTSSNSSDAAFVSGFLDIYENSFTKDVPPAIDPVPTSGITDIEDPTRNPDFSYDTVMERFYEDDCNTYYFAGNYSQYVIVHYSDGSEEDIVTALNSGRAVIADLDQFGIHYYTEAKADLLEEAISREILAHFAGDDPDGLIHAESHVVLANETAHTNGKTDSAKICLLVHHAKYNTYGGTLEAVGGSYGAATITFTITDSGEYVLQEYWEPRDGEFYSNDIRDMFPEFAADAILNDQTQAYMKALKAETYRKAQDYFSGTMGLDERIVELLEEIQSSPLHSSNPGDYILAHENEYAELLGYGEYTLRYCFTEFLNGSQTDLRGHIMALACQDIMAAWDEAYIMDGYQMTGQDWFDEFRANARSLFDQMAPEELEKHYRGAFLLLQMTEESLEIKH